MGTLLVVQRNPYAGFLAFVKAALRGCNKNIFMGRFFAFP
jgi:hypothetical protein